MQPITNKKTPFNYILEDRLEAGICLEGWERKPLMARKANLDGSHIVIKAGEVFLLNANITPEPTSNITTNLTQPEPTRTRKLLLNKQEIRRLIGKIEQKGYTLVPTKIYLKGRYLKVEIALAKGKNNADKRNTVKDRDWARQQAQLLFGRVP